MSDPLTPLFELVVERLPELLARSPRLRERFRAVLAADDLVDQRTLPKTIPARAYLSACRNGRIDGAVKRGRRWVAPRAAVVTWWLAEERAAGNGDAAVEALTAAGFLVDVSSPAVTPPATGTSRRR